MPHGTLGSQGALCFLIEPMLAMIAIQNDLFSSSRTSCIHVLHITFFWHWSRFLFLKVASPDSWCPLLVYDSHAWS